VVTLYGPSISLTVHEDSGWLELYDEDDDEEDSEELDVDREELEVEDDDEDVMQTMRIVGFPSTSFVVIVLEL
jgi:hypothetical protein